MSGYRDCALPRELEELDRLNAELAHASEHAIAIRKARDILVNRLVSRAAKRIRTRVENVSRETNHAN